MTPQEAEKAKQSIKEKMSNRKLKYTITAATAVALATGAGAFAEKAKAVSVEKDPQIHHKFNKAQADIEVTSAANGLVVDLGSGLQLIVEGTGSNKNWAITAPAGFKGSIQAHHNHKGNDYQTHVVSFSGTGEGLQKATLITGTKNLTKIKFSDLIVDTSNEAPVVAPVSLGFIGYYVHSGKIMSTSFYNIDLNQGETIDWGKVDEAYEDWYAQGGLRPKNESYQKSGVGSFHTAHQEREGLGHHTFTEDLIEGYYGRHFIDPGYLEPMPAVNLGFIGYYKFDGQILSTSIYNIELQERDMVDWDAVDAAYEDWYARGGIRTADTPTYQKSGFGSFTTEHANRHTIGHHTFTEALLEGFYGQHYLDPGYVLK